MTTLELYLQIVNQSINPITAVTIFAFVALTYASITYALTETTNGVDLM